MIDRWYDEAERYDVLPLSSPRGRARPRARRAARHRRPSSCSRTRRRSPSRWRPRLVGRSYSITADVTIPSGGAEGVLAHPGRPPRRLRPVPAATAVSTTSSTTSGLEQFRVSSPERGARGPPGAALRVRAHGRPRRHVRAAGACPGRSKLYVGGALVAVAELPYSLVASPGFYGVDLWLRPRRLGRPRGVPARRSGSPARSNGSCSTRPARRPSTTRPSCSALLAHQ